MSIGMGVIGTGVAQMGVIRTGVIKMSFGWTGVVKTDGIIVRFLEKKEKQFERTI